MLCREAHMRIAFMRAVQQLLIFASPSLVSAQRMLMNVFRGRPIRAAKLSARSSFSTSVRRKYFGEWRRRNSLLTDHAFFFGRPLFLRLRPCGAVALISGDDEFGVLS